MPLTQSHVLLGAGGAIAGALAPLLAGEGRRVRLVSRRGSGGGGAEAVRADLLDAAAVQGCIDEGATVYLLAGLRYAGAVWADEWPRILGNVSEACARRRARLIFFDNVYLYGPVDGPMTEETPARPTSRKGEIRARLARDFLAATAAGRLQGCIARAADFYGPGAAHSLAEALVFAPLRRGRRPQWPVDADVPHSFTFVPDCGAALLRLAAADDAWGQAWHLPTAAPPLTGREFVRLAAAALGAAPRLTVLAPGLIRLAGLFSRDARESVEMLYQNDRPYVFDSTKFERRFELRATPYAAGIAATAGVGAPAAAPGGSP